MRIVVQNVLEAQVASASKTVAKIGRGFLLLAGFTQGDNEETARKMADKVLALRVFADEKGLTNKSLGDIGGQILSVSQFTLYADVRGGRRPSFTKALAPAEASRLYDYFNQYLEERFGPIGKGIFGADMQVTLTNDGPFTMILDSEELYGRV